ncbi:MAG: SurA N-terminal domain-containing protein [Bacteroidaceae bacterium]|nr:SurA N-terminal domain-containing protein [Bacteroidaceae bacterium]
MATLQKIRSKGALLLIVVGLALFAFIAEEAVRSLSSSQNESRQRIGKVYGKTINIQEFNDMVDEYVNVVKFSSGQDNLTEQQMQQIRDEVWDTFVQTQLLEHEAEELGLQVTDAEMQDIITTGQNPMLRQTPFVNQQTGTFDVQTLQKFLTDYKAMQAQPNQPAESVNYYRQLYAYWQFVERNIRNQVLAQKFNALLGHAFIANNVQVERNLEAKADEKEAFVVAVPYSSIKDDEIQVDDKEITAKYNELKEAFRMMQGVRDLKYVDVPVKASKADREQLSAEMAEIAAQMATGEDIASIVRKSGSTVAYSAVPVRKAALPSDIARELDSMAVGAQKGPYVNTADNSQNIIRLMAKVSLPDSIQIRQIGVAGVDEAAKKTADSIVVALAAGAPFDSIAKKYNQAGAEQWITSKDYERSALDENNVKLIRAINAQAAGTTQQVTLSNGILIVKVLDRKGAVDKYDVAVVKRPIEFSNETFNKTYNDFAQFVATNKTIEDIEANAVKSGYMVQQQPGIPANIHNIAGIASTREALRWLFSDDREVGEVSDVYTCGNNDHLMIVMLSGIHEGMYRDLETVKDYLQSEVIRDKKAGKIMTSMASASNLAAAAKIAGALPIDTVRHITFNAPVFVQSVGASEPALAGAVAKTAKGGFLAGVKGNAAVYALQVTAENKKAAQTDDAAKKAEQSQISSQAMQAANRYMQELYLRADVKDNRHLFY